MEDRADFEQAHVHEAARLVPGRRLKQAGQKVGAHVAHFRGNRVFEHRRRGSAVEQGRAGLVDEGVGHAFVVAERGAGPAGGLFAALHRRHHRARHAIGEARQRPAFELGERGDTRDLLDQIGLAGHIGAPAGHLGQIAFQTEAEAGQRLALFAFGDVHADKALHPRGVELVGAAVIGNGAGDDHTGGFAAAEIDDHLGCQFQARQGEFGIDAPLEPVARVRVDLESAAGQRDLHVVPEGGFEEDVDGLLGHARSGAAHDAGDAFRFVGVGDYHHAGFEGIGLVVERLDGLAALGAVHAQGAAGDLVGVEDVQRAVAVVGEEVGHIDQRGDRAQPDGAQLVLKPLRRRAVFDPADQPACEDRAAVEGIWVDGDGDRAGIFAGNRIDGPGLQLADPACGEIARDALHAKRVGPVGGDGNLDHRIDLGGVVIGQPVDEAFADLARGEFDDAVMFVRQLEFALRGHHAEAFDAADLADADGGVDSRHVDARLCHDDGDALARVRGAADDLQLALVGRHLADTQAVGIGVGLGMEHPADGKFPEPVSGVRHLFDLEPEIGQRLGDLVDAGGGFEVRFQPGQGEFHRFGFRRAISGRAGNGKEWPSAQGTAEIRR